MLNLKQKEFVDYALKTFGTNELTTAQLKEANSHFGCKYAPQWLIKNTDYKVGKSLFKLPTENEDAVSSAKVTPTEKVKSQKAELCAAKLWAWMGIGSFDSSTEQNLNPLKT